MAQDPFAEELASLRRQGLYRELRDLVPRGGTRALHRGRECVVFASNDYLSLSSHPAVVEASARILATHGAGAPASRLISGNLDIHRRLEEALARFKKRPAALLFSTGYMANLGVLDTLAGKGDAIFSDALNHASIVDACRLSRAEVFVYAHRDMENLETLLRQTGRFQRRIVVTDTVFSMNGHLAPLAELRSIATRYDALVVTDEAHATGVLGAQGRGLEEELGLTGASDVVVGTLGKALGVAGGFVASRSSIIDVLTNRARTFLYTTAPPPSVCGALLASLELLPTLVTNLRQKAARLRELLKEKGVIAGGEPTPILPILTHDPDATMKAAAFLLDRGYIVAGIRPPTVPEGQCRLRITVNCGHTEPDLAGLADALGEWFKFNRFSGSSILL
jgi:8-amino-7-oxononanoate synthase